MTGGGRGQGATACLRDFTAMALSVLKDTQIALKL